MAVRLYIGNLPYEADEQRVGEFLAEHGVLSVSIHVPRDRDTGMSRGFAFISLARQQEAQDAIARLNGMKLNDRRIKVRLAEERRSKQAPAGRDQQKATATDRPARSSKDERFVHAYNFVSVPAEGLGAAADIEPFRRQEPAPHDRYERDRYTGHIDCTLRTLGPWFIPDPRKQATDTDNNDHKILGYFTLDAVSDWELIKERAERDKTSPAIPAASLRGMVRSVFEAATLSCLRVIDPGKLDYRIATDPAWQPREAKLPDGRLKPSCMPVRVLRRRDDHSLEVEVLDGRRPRRDGRRRGDPSNTLPVALVHAYEPKVLASKEQPGQETPLWQNLGPIPEGSPVVCIIDDEPEPKQRKGKVAYHYREAKVVVPANQESSLRKPNKGELKVCGYLHRTGPNIENKHHERIFFRWPDEKELTLEVDKEVVHATEQALKGYYERHGDKAAGPTPRRLPGPSMPPYPSDFVGKQPVSEGALFYALVEGLTSKKPIVRGLYPVALPRLTHEDGRIDLLHPDFQPCDDLNKLCASCRVFGWTRPGPLGQPHAPEAGRLDASSGHVRFSHAQLRGDWGPRGPQATLATLAILGSPKPTTTAFYLKAKPEGNRETRWPPALQSIPFPLYRKSEAALRGRKFYRRRQVHPGSDNPSKGGILRPRSLRDSQNQTVHLLPQDLEFGFRVSFDNLSKTELSALLFALRLQPPAQWGKPPEAMRHGIGHGKPLGLGRCEIRIDDLTLDSFAPESPAHRYARAPSFAPALSSADSRPDVKDADDRAQMSKCLDNWNQELGRAWDSAKRKRPELTQVYQRLMDMLAELPKDTPVHYPPNPNGEFTDNYEWFKKNRGAGHHHLPEPEDERQDRKKWLPIDPGS